MNNNTVSKNFIIVENRSGEDAPPNGTHPPLLTTPNGDPNYWAHADNIGT